MQTNFPACSYTVNLNDWSNFTHYVIKTSLRATMTNKCNLNIIGNNVPKKWDLPCPILYFSLDSATQGNAGGANAAVISFPGSEVLGSMFYLSNPGTNIQADSDLGHYPSSEFCFAVPQQCTGGMALSFWLNVLQESNVHQVIFTTMKNNGPGRFN